MPPKGTKQSDAWYDPRTGGEAVRIEAIEFDGPHEPLRTNCFSIYRIGAGHGNFWADTSRLSFVANSLLFFVPYQHIRFDPQSPVRGDRILFHANFLCVETFHAEVGCSGSLFNDPFGNPAVYLGGDAAREIGDLIDRLRREDRERHLAYSEVMLSHLKVLLVLATRIKGASAAACGPGDAVGLRNPLLIELRDLIERNYRSLHAPSAYARQLHVTLKTLGRIVREELGTTPTDLIRRRILTHAKWQLLHTLRPVKEIAREVGFEDELYFSRLFRKATGCSPTFFREFETRIRNGSNLSMSLGESPIHPTDDSAESQAVRSRSRRSDGRRSGGGDDEPGKTDGTGIADGSGRPGADASRPDRGARVDRGPESLPVRGGRNRTVRRQ